MVSYTASIFLLFKLVASKQIPRTAIEIAINQFNGFEGARELGFCEDPASRFAIRLHHVISRLVATLSTLWASRAKELLQDPGDACVVAFVKAPSLPAYITLTDLF